MLGGMTLAQADAAKDFMLAAALDNSHGLGQLLDAGLDPNLRKANGDTALHVATREESAQALARLLQHPAIEVDLSNEAGETPLMLAALRGRLDLAKPLLAHGARINRSGWTALHYACSGPGSDVVAWLIVQGADLDARAPNGTTPLMMAAGYGGPSSAELLLAAGADAALRNEQGLSAADFARRAGYERLEQMLLKSVGP